MVYSVLCIFLSMYVLSVHGSQILEVLNCFSLSDCLLRIFPLPYAKFQGGSQSIIQTREVVEGGSPFTPKGRRERERKKNHDAIRKGSPIVTSRINSFVTPPLALSFHVLALSLQHSLPVIWDNTWVRGGGGNGRSNASPSVSHQKKC